MPNLQGTVGESGANAKHEVALVQVMLRLATNAKGESYLKSDYDGVYGNTTKDAIIAFQKDKDLLPKPATAVAAAGAAGAAVKPAPVAQSTEKEGLVDPAGKTYKLLTDALPATHAKIRAMEGLKTIYLEGDAADAEKSASLTAGDAGLNGLFSNKVASLTRSMHKTYGIVLWVEPKKGRTRTFQMQSDLVDSPDGNPTNAGPGESNHNWGFAVDIGFDQFQWLAPDSAIKTDDFWLNKLSKTNSADSTHLWDNRNGLGSDLALYKTHKSGDLIHLQNFDDSHVSLGKCLAAQLTRAGNFKWAVIGGKPNQYSTDMGTGGALVNVGTANQIWKRQSNPPNSLFAAWQNAQEKAAWNKLPQPARDQLNKAAIAKLPAGAKAPVDAGLKVWKETEITPAITAAAKAALRAEMEAAEAKRDLWQPTP